MGAQRLRYADGRWHLQHGPIDLIIGADGDDTAVRAAHDACWARFTGLLDELVGELAALREPVPHGAMLADNPCVGPVARRMWHACHAHRERFITPMAAVAGSVADELIGAYRREGITRAYVNNGGDIAFHLAAPRDEARGVGSANHDPAAPTRTEYAASPRYTIGVFADLARFDPAHLQHDASGQPLDAHLTLDAQQPVRGIATSGWRGRSFSLGIADSVTILARDAATADAAATIVANAVDVAHPDIVRRPASALKDNSDLGDRLVTVAVPPLPPALVELALERGVASAQRLQDAGIIEGAALFLQCHVRVVGIGARRPHATLAQGMQAARHAIHSLNAAVPYQTEAPCSTSAAC